MPKIPDLKKVLVIGSGPIQIGQAAEFDYSGSQAVRAMKEDGLQVVLVNPNPATLQTDLEIADIVYLEPLTQEVLKGVIAKEKPQGIIGTMAGQTGLNLLVELEQFLKANEVLVLGTGVQAIKLAEDRKSFADLMIELNEEVCPSVRAHNLGEGKAAAQKIGLPVITRPDFCMGGAGTRIARNESELEEVLKYALNASSTHSVLVEKSVEGLGEFEYEVIRDAQDNCITICSMENIDPVGVHTGESIVIAPAQTLPDNLHQKLRSAAIRIIRALKVVGACNIQFAVNQQTGTYFVIEVNPRTSRSSALASKATGYPIALVAAKIAIGYSLPEIRNRITGKTACFEPALDYVVIKIPRWPFDKFSIDGRIGTKMLSTGEVMAIGRTFSQALNKAERGLELRSNYLMQAQKLNHVEPHELRLFKVMQLLREGQSVESLWKKTSINPWFIHKLREIVDSEKKVALWPKEPYWWASSACRDELEAAKRCGFSDEQISAWCGKSVAIVRSTRKAFGLKPSFKMVDTCSGEFEALTPYFYSAYESEDDSPGAQVSKVSTKPTVGRVIILGSGPIRIGQGIEFDYCTVHAVMALRARGFQAVIINNNPETVSTDFDVSDRLYFEPLTLEDVLEVIQKERDLCKLEGANLLGVLVQFGGQTAINLARPLAEHGVRVLGTSIDSIDSVENRKRFKQLTKNLGIPIAESSTAYSVDEALEVASYIGYPVLVRPSYVLGGRAMEIVESKEELVSRMEEAVRVSAGRPVAIDHFIPYATEVDVDLLADGKRVVIAGISEQIEETGVHSGDSACVLPSQTITKAELETIRQYSKTIALALGVRGLCNIQMSVKAGTVCVLEVNPRASRTVPFVSKATGVPVAKIAAVLQADASSSLDDFLSPDVSELKTKLVAVKVPVFPYSRFPELDPVGSPEMKSTGEVMGLADDFTTAYAKALSSAGAFPKIGVVLIEGGAWSKPLSNAFAKAGLPAYRCKEVSEAISLIEAGKADCLVCSRSAQWATARKLASSLGLPVVSSSFGALRLAVTLKTIAETKGKIVDVFPIVSLNQAAAGLEKVMFT